jgi:hypothetical protein
LHHHLPTDLGSVTSAGEAIACIRSRQEFGGPAVGKPQNAPNRFFAAFVGLAIAAVGPGAESCLHLVPPPRSKHMPIASIV